MTDPLDPDTPYMDPDGVRARVSGLDSDTRYPDELLESLIAEFEGIIEADCGRYFTPRTFTETVTAGRGPLLLAHVDVTEITAITYDIGTAPDLPDGVTIDAGGYSLSLAPRGSVWPCGTIIGLEGVAGMPAPPPLVLGACAEYVRAEAIQAKGDTPRNTIGTRTDIGWEPAPVADLRAGRLTRWTTVNEKIDQIRLQFNARIPGIA